MSSELEPAERDEWADDEEQRHAIDVMDSSVAAAISRSEVSAQLDAAHRYSRSIKRFMQSSITLATINQKTAESCMYALPRSGKVIAGPSVRLAEIMASAYGNLHIGARVVDDTHDKAVTAQGVAWDLETNLRVTVEVRRRITDKHGNKFNEDMINVTAAAACSIALRNAVFRVIPRTFVDQVYERCKLVAIGKAETLTQRRDEVLARLAKMGATQDRVLNALKVKGVEDIGAEQLEVLIGLGTALKQGDRSVDELFPPPIAAVPGAEQPGRKVTLKREKKAEPPPEREHAPSCATRAPEPGPCTCKDDDAA